MDPCVRDIVNFLKNLGYTVRQCRCLTNVLNNHHLRVEPPNFPVRVDTEQDKVKYMVEEYSKLNDLLYNDFHNLPRPKDNQNYYFTIKNPTVMW